MNVATIPLLFIGLFAGESDQSVHLTLASGSYQVEIADGPFEQMRGLMGREDLASNEGMLFIYPEDRQVQFWMKNVAFPLDMIFLDSCGKVVQLHENAQPDDASIVEPSLPVRAVLELRGGTSKRDQIRPGDQVMGSGVGAYFASC